MGSDSTWFDKALEKCIHENLYSANDFKDVVLYLKKPQQEPLVSLEQEKRPIHKVVIPVGTRPLWRRTFMKHTVKEIQSHFKLPRLAETAEELPQLL